MGHALTENRHGLAVRRRDHCVGHGGTRSRPRSSTGIARWRVEAVGVGSRWATRVLTSRILSIAAPQGDPPYRRPGPRHQDRQAAQDQDRRAHDAPSRLRRQPTLPQAHRGGLRLGQDSAGLSKTKFRGRHRVDASFTLALAAYNLVRLWRRRQHDGRCRHAAPQSGRSSNWTKPRASDRSRLKTVSP